MLKLQNKLSLIILLAPLMLMVACNKETPKPMTVDLPVMGMTCETCENAISGQLYKLDGVIGVKASHADQIVTVRYDANLLSEETIVSNIEILEFDVVGKGITPGSETTEPASETAEPTSEEQQ